MCIYKAKENSILHGSILKVSTYSTDLEKKNSMSYFHASVKVTRQKEKKTLIRNSFRRR